MEEKIEMLKELLQKSEDFIKTNIELYRLKAIDKVTDVFSSVASSIIISLVFIFFVTMISIGIALWIGESMGHTYYGFLIVAGFYLLTGIILIATNKVFLERTLNDYIVRLIFKEKTMKGLKNDQELQFAIMELTVKRNREREALMQTWNDTKVEFRPGNLLKDGAKDIFTSSGFKSGVFKSILSVGAGFLTRNLIMGPGTGMIGKVVGTLAQTGATSLAYKSSETLKKKGAPVLSNLLKKLKIGE